MNILNWFTLRSLAANKTRTLVTIIGIALSVAMFTAVTSIIVSFQSYMLRAEISAEGAWEGKMEGCSRNIVNGVEQAEGVKSCTKAANLGYARLEDCQNESKPYLFVLGIGTDFTDFSPINMVEGRMPENNTELVLPKHLQLNGGVEYQVGDTLHLQLGKRVYKNGEWKGTPVGGQEAAFISEEGDEALADTVSKTYTVVGICERPICEDFSAPGYTSFTLDNEAEADSYDLMMTFYNPKKADILMEEYTQLDGEEAAGGIVYQTHRSLLRFQGKSTNDRYNQVLYSMGAILMAIIVIGSISLIYNAFSISVSERTRQFGLLKSIGATKKQMRQSVLFEALVLSLAGIPLGILAGLGGIGITFHYVDGLIKHLWASDKGAQVALTLVVTWQSVIIAVLIGLVTVVVSAMIPARKAVKLSAIQAIRRNGDVRICPERVRTSGLTYRLFGFEGMLASKNFKRNRKKHRTTVFSLFISIVLFSTATSFSGYLKASQKTFSSAGNYDVSFTLDEDSIGTHTVEEVGQEAEAISPVEQAGYSRMTIALMDVPKEYINGEYLELKEKQKQEFLSEEAADGTEKNPEQEDSEEQTMSVQAAIYFIRDEIYRDYLEKNRLDTKKYMDTKNWTPLVWDGVTIYQDDKIFVSHILKKTGWSDTLNLVREQEGYFFRGKQGDVCIFENDENDEAEPKRIPVEKACCRQTVTMGEIQDGELVLGAADLRWQEAVTMVLPYSAIEDNKLPKDISYMDSIDYKVKAGEHQKAYQELSEYLSDVSFGSGAAASLYDNAEDVESERALILIIDIFSYGFIVLISLISIANVFNTISTNVQLRRQEFAMLKSVGMTGKGFDKMMNYECALYGVKALLYGVPASLLVSRLMYTAMERGWNAGFILPWQGLLIVTASVFVIVFATMLYSMSKIKRDNPIEALRNENL